MMKHQTENTSLKFRIRMRWSRDLVESVVSMTWFLDDHSAAIYITFPSLHVLMLTIVIEWCDIIMLLSRRASSTTFFLNVKMESASWNFRRSDKSFEIWLSNKLALVFCRNPMSYGTKLSLLSENHHSRCFLRYEVVWKNRSERSSICIFQQMNKNDFFRSIMVKGKIISMMFFHDDIQIIMVSLVNRMKSSLWSFS